MSARSAIPGGSTRVRSSSCQDPDPPTYLPAAYLPAAYLIASAPAFATWPSCCAVPPLAPIAPTTGESILEHLAGPAEESRGTGLLDCDLDRTELGIIHSLEVDQEPAVIDDRDRIGRRSGFWNFGYCCGGGLFGVVDADRRTIRGCRRRCRGSRRLRRGRPGPQLRCQHQQHTALVRHCRSPFRADPTRIRHPSGRAA